MSQDIDSKSSIIFIDYLRSISILYIVGYLHLLNYTSIFPNYFNYLTYILTLVALSLLVFISGYLIGIKEWSINSSTVANFFFRRFLRIYPPFLVAVLLFAFFKIIDTSSAQNVALLMSQFFPPSPITLWFVPMIVFFYALSPLLYNYARKYWCFTTLVCCLCIVLVSYSHFTNLLDRRLILYLPIFAVGLFLGRNDRLIESIPIWLLVFSCPIGWFIGASANWETDLSNYFMSPFLTSVALLIFKFSMKFVREDVKFGTCDIVKSVSYASYFMYLFHRPIFTVMLKVLSPEPEMGKLLYLVGICLPVIIILSWFTQKCYDSLCNVFLARKLNRRGRKLA